MNSRAGSSLPWARSAARRKLTVVTPGMAIGFWKERKSPSWARRSGVRASRSWPSKLADPPVTWYLGWPIRL